MAAGFRVDVGEWTAIQSNGGRPVFDLRQDQAGVLSGDADSGGTDGDILEGSRVDGNFFVCRVKWGDGSSVGNYQGFRGPDGTLSGTGFDERNPESQTLWHADRKF